MTTFRGVPEKTTQVYKATIKDEDGNAIAGSSLSTLALTLYSVHSGTIINSRNAQDVLNKNNITVGEDGLLTWTMQPADNDVVDEDVEKEHHRAMFEWTWAGGAKAGKQEVDLFIDNFSKVT